MSIIGKILGVVGLLSLLASDCFAETPPNCRVVGSSETVAVRDANCTRFSWYPTGKKVISKGHEIVCRGQRYVQVFEDDYGEQEIGYVAVRFLVRIAPYRCP
jgi:hypothetical protein